MPSITYIQDREEPNTSSQNIPRQQAPEPPARYDGQRPPQLPPQGANGNPDPQQEFDSTRTLTAVAQIMALVSIVIGGVILSIAALVVALIAYRRISAHLAGQSAPDAAWAVLKRSGIVALVMSASALALNAVALAYFYPMMLQMLNSGEYASLLGSGQSPTPPGSSGTSVWG